MTQRWVVLDQMIRDLGALKVDTVPLFEPPYDSLPVTATVQGAIHQAAEAVHLCVDSDDAEVVRAARLAIERARVHVDKALAVLQEARDRRLEAHEMRSRAAVQREAAKLLRRTERGS
jgi:hypothetical protein